MDCAEYKEYTYGECIKPAFGSGAIIGGLLAPIYYLVRENLYVSDFVTNQPNIVLDYISNRFSQFNQEFGTNLITPTQNRHELLSTRYGIMNSNGREIYTDIYDSSILDAVGQLKSLVASQTTILKTGEIDGYASGEVGQIVVKTGSENMVVEANNLIASLPDSVSNLYYGSIYWEQLRSVILPESIIAGLVAFGVIVAYPTLQYVTAKIKIHKLKKMLKKYDSKEQ